MTVRNYTEEQYTKLLEWRLKRIEAYAKELIDTKVDPWFRNSNRSEVSHEIGMKVLNMVHSLEDTTK